MLNKFGVCVFLYENENGQSGKAKVENKRFECFSEIESNQFISTQTGRGRASNRTGEKAR